MHGNIVKYLKELFDVFLREAEQNTINHSNKKDRFSLNAEVFEFQAYIATRLKNFDVNLLLNSSINSQSITSSFDKEVRPFSPDEYCLAFFDFLNVQKDHRLELYQLIDLFIEEHKEELNWQDIVITASGATRCRTNLRFALNRLRRIGLIQKQSQGGKRVFLPTLSGELVFYCWRKHLYGHDFTVNCFESPKESLSIKQCGFPELFKILNKLMDPNNVDVQAFWTYKNQHELFMRSDDILTDMRAFLQNSVITEHGILFKDHKD
jgi:hypothetical protein